MDNLPLVKIGEDAVQKPEMHSGPRKNLTILVLGETSRAQNFSLGGYERETNPRLKQDDVIYFANTTSRHGHRGVGTLHVLQHAARALR
jgi:lipid A ethanolaminephosphotransferase